MSGGIISLIIGILIAVVIAVALLPTIKSSIGPADNWSVAEYALLSLIPLLLVIVIVVAVLKAGKISK